MIELRPINDKKKDSKKVLTWIFFFAGIIFGTIMIYYDIIYGWIAIIYSLLVGIFIDYNYRSKKW